MFLLDIWVFPLFSISKKPAITDEWRQSSKTQERLEAQKERKERLAAREGALAQVRSFARGTFADALALVAAVMLCFSAIALGSYSSADPGFTSTGTQTAHNMCGLVGAWIADFGYWMFGLSVWWIVIGLFAILLLCIRGRIKWKSGEPFELRICSALIGLLFLRFFKELVPDIELQNIALLYAVITLCTLAVELDVLGPYVLLNQRFRKQGNGLSHKAIQPLTGIVFLHNYLSHGHDYTL